jgi:hypothetical protein
MELDLGPLGLGGNTLLDVAAGAARASTPSSSRVPQQPPTASRGKLVPFTRKRARAATTRHRGNQ